MDFRNFLRINKRRQSITDFSQDRIVTVCGKPLCIGRYTYGYEDAKIFSWGEDMQITIGRFCSIAFGLKLYCGGNHRVDWISTYPFGHQPHFPLKLNPVKGHPKTNGDIRIGHDVWIGGDVTILSGVTIGDGAVIAANSHVIADIPPYTIAGGNPAKEFKKRFPEDIVNRLLRIRWWEYPIEQIERIVPFLCNQNDISLLDNLSRIENALRIET